MYSLYSRLPATGSKCRFENISAVAPNFRPSSAGYVDIGCSVKYMRCMDDPPSGRDGAGRALGRELDDEPGQGLGLLDLGEMARPLEDGEAGPAQRTRVLLAALERHNPIPPAPHHERGNAHAAQEMGQRRVVHVGLPGDA